jgi:hypothetical protein
VEEPNICKKRRKGPYLYDDEGNKLVIISILGTNDFRSRTVNSSTSREEKN